MLSAVQVVVALLTNHPDELICLVDFEFRFIPQILALSVECLFPSPLPDSKTAVGTSLGSRSQILRVRGNRVKEAPSPG